MSYSQTVKNRLEYIEFILLFKGWISRNDLMEQFGVSEAAATRDFKCYADMCPKNMSLNKATKRWEVDFETFDAHFAKSKDISYVFRRLRQSKLGSTFDIGVTEVPRLSQPDVRVLSCVTRAITNKNTLKIRYVAASRPEQEVVIVPHTLVDNGIRWHVRGFDRTNNRFWDFVLKRITYAEEIPDLIRRSESIEGDDQWNRVVRLELAPHPNSDNLFGKQAIEIEYGMSDGVLVQNVRAAIAGYWLRHWNVDCSPNHSKKGKHYQLYLKNPMTLYDVDSRILAPGIE